MIKNKDGSIDFIVDGIVFRFEKDNYERHVLKRPKIAHELAQIETAIVDPDRITSGPKASYKHTHYKVLHYKDEGKTRYITFWKVPVYYKSKTFALIATAIYTTSPNYYAINPLEDTICRKSNSEI